MDESFSDTKIRVWTSTSIKSSFWLYQLLFTHHEETGMSIIRYLQWHILNLFFVFLNFLWTLEQQTCISFILEHTLSDMLHYNAQICLSAKLALNGCVVRLLIVSWLSGGLQKLCNPNLLFYFDTIDGTAMLIQVHITWMTVLVPALWTGDIVGPDTRVLARTICEFHRMVYCGRVLVMACNL